MPCSVAHGGEVRHKSDVPEQGRHGSVRRDREDVPHKRAAELRPCAHRAGIREEPIREPRTPGMQHREKTGAHDGEQRHSFCKAVDRIAPALLEQRKNGGDQRAGMADTDPPHEVDDGESPADGNVDPPNTNALEEEQRACQQQQLQHAEGDGDAAQPPERRPASQHDRRDLVGDRAKAVARLDDRRSLDRDQLVYPSLVEFVIDRASGGHDCFCSTALLASVRLVSTSAGFGFVTVAKYVVRGRVFKSASNPKFRGCAFSLLTRLFGLLISPKTIASAGHACWHAVLSSSPIRVSAISVDMRARLMRCTQYVHFSITPRLRTVTSGLCSSLSEGVS